MDKKDIRIVYMGTPDFAVPTLDALVSGGYNVVGVITMPDKPAGRGHKVQFSPVKEYALAHGLPLLQPERLKDEAFLADLRAWRADLQIVVAFRMLPEVVWAMPRMGTFNLHAALLPQYRGAAPINWAVINGETVTGATTFFLCHEIDTGRIILKEELPIGPDENVGSVHDRLMLLGKGLVCRTVDLLLQAEGRVEEISTTDQTTLYKDVSELRPAPKIFKDDCRINWNDTARHIFNHVRGLSPYPAAWTEIKTSTGEIISPVKVYKVSVFEEENANCENGRTKRLPVGEMETDGRTYIRIGCLDGAISLDELQLPGKKRLDIRSLLNGFTF